MPVGGTQLSGMFIAAKASIRRCMCAGVTSAFAALRMMWSAPSVVMRTLIFRVFLLRFACWATVRR